MTEYRKYLLSHRNYYALFYGIFSIIILFVFFYYIFNSITEHRNSNFEFFNKTFSIIYPILLISITIWTVLIARRKNQLPVLWLFISFYIGPIALIIISLLDYRIKDKLIKKIVFDTRIDFLQKVKYSNFNKSELINEYEKIIIDKIKIELTNNKLETIKELIDQGVINPELDLSEKKEQIESYISNEYSEEESINWNPNWLEQENICPACGKELRPEQLVCIKCGLKVK